MSTTFVNGNSRADSLEEVKEKKLTDAVILVIRGEDEEEESSNEKCDTSNDPSTISTLSNFRSNSSEVSALKKQLTGSNLIQMADLERSPKSKVPNSTSSGQHQTPPEIKNFSTPALNGKSLNWSNSHHNMGPAPNNKVSATTTPEKETSPNTKPRAPLVAPQGLAGGDEEEEDDNDDSYTDPNLWRTSLMESPGPAGEEEIEADDDIYKIKKSPKLMKSWCKKLQFWVLVEWIALVSIMGILIASLTSKKFKHYKILKLHTGKWCVLLLVIVCGRLVTDWFINGLVFLIDRNFFLKRKVLYYVYGLKNSVRICIWLGLVLLSWVLLFRGRVKRSERIISKYVTRALVSILTGAVIWLIKDSLVKILAASVNVKSFFDRIQESLYNQYYIHTLSGPPLMKLPENITYTKAPGHLNVRSVKNEKEGEGQEVIDVAKLHKLKSGKVSAWIMKLLSNVISTTKLSTISSSIDELDGKQSKQKDVEINCEWDAKAAAAQIFKNVAKPGSKFIYDDDLLRFLSKEDVDKVFRLCERALEAGKISKSMLRNWVVKVYHERTVLAHSLNDTQTAVKQLNKVASVIVLVVIFIAWLLLMEIATTKLLLFISSQMILIVFVFGNTAKNVFEGIIFVFVIHPFDVGDRCVIDGIQMIVEEMNIFSTIFLRYDNQKIYYPNSVLATRCIGNMYRSPCMGDSVEFTVNVSTTAERIMALKARIKSYIESKPQYWNRSHNIVLLEIENASKMKMALHVTHTMNHQNMEKKNNRRSELVFELKKIFEELSVGYQVLPQEVQACYNVIEEQ